MPPSATPTKAVCEKATFVSDVTIPDNTVMTPGTAFTKTWKVRNDSTCTWDLNYALVFAGGTLLSRQNTVNFPGQVPPGRTTDLSIEMTAPLAGGSYQSNWLLRSPGGTTFGVGPAGDNPLFVRILVTMPVEPNPAYAFDFTARSCDAQWRSAAGVISCNNISSDPRGSAIALAASPLERGQENEPGLWVRPDQNPNWGRPVATTSWNTEASDSGMRASRMTRMMSSWAAGPKPPRPRSSSSFTMNRTARSK